MGQRVAAHERAGRRGGGQLQADELSRAVAAERATIGRGEGEARGVDGLRAPGGHPKATRTGPCRGPTAGGERIDAPLEMPAPLARERLDPERSAQRGHVLGAAERPQAHELAHAQPVRVSSDHHGAISGAQLTLPLDRQVEAHAVGLHEAVHDRVVAEPDAELEARVARLGHPQHRGSDRDEVPDAHLVLEQPGDRQVLAEHAPPRRELAELLPPERVVLAGIGVHGLDGTAVVHQVRLPVTAQVVASDGDRAHHRALEDARRDLTPAPADRAGLAHVHAHHLAARAPCDVAGHGVSIRGAAVNGVIVPPPRAQRR